MNSWYRYKNRRDDPVIYSWWGKKPPHHDSTLFILLEIKAFAVWEGLTKTEGDKERLLYWPITFLLLNISRCVIFKVPLSNSSASRPWGRQPVACCKLLCGPLHQQGTQPLADAPVTNRSLLAASWDWLKIHTARISRGQIYIFFLNIYTFPFNYETDSAYFHRCVLCRNIWLMARSWVNMQQFEVKFKKELLTFPFS